MLLKVSTDNQVARAVHARLPVSVKLKISYWAKKMIRHVLERITKSTIMTVKYLNKNCESALTDSTWWVWKYLNIEQLKQRFISSVTLCHTPQCLRNKLHYHVQKLLFFLHKLPSLHSYCTTADKLCSQWWHQESSFGGGLQPRWFGGQKSYSGVHRRNASRGSSPEAEAVCRHCLQILTAKTIKIWKFSKIHLLIIYHYVSLWGSATFWGFSPLVHAWRRIVCSPVGN